MEWNYVRARLIFIFLFYAWLATKLSFTRLRVIGRESFVEGLLPNKFVCSLPELAFQYAFAHVHQGLSITTCVKVKKNDHVISDEGGPHEKTAVK